MNKNYVLGAGLLFVVFAIVYALLSNHNTDEPTNIHKSKITRAEIQTRNSALYLKVFELLDSTREEEIKPSQILSIKDAEGKKDFNWNNQTGQIYFCREDEAPNGARFKVIYKEELHYKDTLTNSVVFTSKDHPNSLSTDCLLHAGDIKVRFNNCQMIVEVPPFLQKSTRTYHVSIDGKKSGDYKKKKLKWNIEDLSGKPVDVWLAVEGRDTVGSRMNGESQIPMCKITRSEEHDFVKDMTRHALAFGNDPDNMEALIAIKEVVNKSLGGSKLLVIVDNETMEGMTVWENRFYNHHLDNGTTYRLVGEPQITGTGNNKKWKLVYATK